MRVPPGCAPYGGVARYLHFGQNKFEFTNENKRGASLQQSAQLIQVPGADGGT